MGPKVRGRSVGTPSKAEEGIKTTINNTTTSTAANGDDSADNHAENAHRARGSSEPRTPHRQQQTPHQEQRFGKRGSGQAFALGLFQILKTEDPKVIGWSPSGKAFRIGDSEKFCREIMPRFFKQNKYSSFQRQLNLYGFRKLVRGNEAGGYMHPLFERGKPEQLSQVRRGYFPEIPPEFAQDVHGHGLNDNNTNTSKPDGIPGGGGNTGRGRKSEPHLGMGGWMEPRSSSVGRPERVGMNPAAVLAADLVTDAAVPRGANRFLLANGSENVRGDIYGGHVPTMATMAKRREWEEWDDRALPPLVTVTKNLKNPNGEMPPTLGRLVPTTSGLSRESSPMKPNGVSHSNGHEDGMRTHALPLSQSSNVRQSNAPPSQPEGYHPPPYGRSQDDLNLTPRSHLSYGPMIPMPGGGPPSFDTEWSPKGFPYDSTLDVQLSRGGGQRQEFFVSNGGKNDNNHHLNRPSHHSPRALLQQTHSRDDLDALRPRKTRRRTEPTSTPLTASNFMGDFMGDPLFHQQYRQQQQQQPFLRANPPRRRGEAGGVQGYPNPPYCTDEPPAAPGRLRPNTQSRSVRRGSSKKEHHEHQEQQRQKGGVEGRVAREPPAKMSLEDPDDADMETDGAGMIRVNPRGEPVQALDNNFSKLGLSEGPLPRSQQHQLQHQNHRHHQQAQQLQQHRHQQPRVNETRDFDAKRQQQQQNLHHMPVVGASGVVNQELPGSGSGGARKLTAADAVELLGRRSSVEEVIELLSAPTSGSDGTAGFEDETSKMHDSAQYDSWRNSLTKVLGHLGFDFQDEHGVPVNEGKLSPDGGSSTRSISQYLSWGGTSAMSFEEQPEEFHESLKQIPMRWRSSLSSIMTTMASNGALDDNGGAQSGNGGEGGMDVAVAGEGRSGKRLEQQASLEMLQSVMRETLESMSSGQEHDSTDGGEEEAKAAATAALAMGSMCRDKANGVGTCGSGGSDDISANGSGRSGRAYNVSPAIPGGDVSVGSVGSVGVHRYYAQKGRAHGGGGSGGGGGGYNHEHTTF